MQSQAAVATCNSHCNRIPTVNLCELQTLAAQISQVSAENTNLSSYKHIFKLQATDGNLVHKEMELNFEKEVFQYIYFRDSRWKQIRPS